MVDRLAERPLVSVVLPCLNEEQGVGACIQKIQRSFAEANIDGEIIVCDNGSTDNSVTIATSMGVHVVHQPIRGYGNAYLKGFASARGQYLIMGDADDTYDFALVPEFLDKLMNHGYEFVSGSRYIKNGHRSIPFLNRFFGNPILTVILNLLFGTHYTDVYCGFRGFNNMRADFFGQEGDTQWNRQRLTQTTRHFRHYHLDIRDRAALAFLVQSEGALQPTKFVLNTRGV